MNTEEKKAASMIVCVWCDEKKCCGIDYCVIVQKWLERRGA